MVFCSGLGHQTKDGPELGFCDELVTIQAHNFCCQRSVDISDRLSQMKWGQALLREMLLWPEPENADLGDWQVSLASGGAVETWPVLGMLTGIAGCKGQEHMWPGAHLHVWLQYISFCPALTGR